MEQVVMWIMKDELLHTESCSSKILLNEVQLTQFLPSLLVTHEPKKDGHVSKVILWAVFYHLGRGNPVVLQGWLLDLNFSNNIHINPLNAELNPICCLLALLGVHHFFHVSRIRVKSLTLRLLMSYIYMGRLFLMFLDHTRRRTTVGRTPLDEWSARRRDLCLTTHDTHNR